jgi:hypothetical protein
MWPVPSRAPRLSSITFDVDIPAATSFIELEFAFSGADEGDFGAVFLGVPDAAVSGPARSRIPQESAVQNIGAYASSVAVLSASSTLQNGDFQSSGSIALPTSQARRRRMMTMPNYPAGRPGSTFRVRHVCIASVCPARCFGKRATICGTRGHDRLTGTAGRDVKDPLIFFLALFGNVRCTLCRGHAVLDVGWMRSISPFYGEDNDDFIQRGICLCGTAVRRRDA